MPKLNNKKSQRVKRRANKKTMKGGRDRESSNRLSGESITSDFGKDYLDLDERDVEAMTTITANRAKASEKTIASEITKSSMSPGSVVMGVVALTAAVAGIIFIPRAIKH